MCETASEPDREAYKIKFRNFVISLASSSVLERFNRKEKIWVEDPMQHTMLMIVLCIYYETNITLFAKY